MQLFLNKRGQTSLEFVVVISMILFITFGLILSSLQYYSLRSAASQTNFEVGRFVSQMAYCNTLPESNNESLSGLLRTPFVNGRNIKISIHKAGSSSLTLNPPTSTQYQTTVNIYCPPDWDRTIPFRTTTETKWTTNSLLYFFPKNFVADSVFMVEYGN